MDEDQTKIGNILMMGFFIKSLKILIVITSCSYVFAMLFQLLLEIQSDYMKWDECAPPGMDQSLEPEHFVSFYGLQY